MWEIVSYKAPREYWKTAWMPLAFGLFAAVATWGPQLVEPFRFIDLALARWLNSLIGRSTALDHVLAVLNSRNLADPIGVSSIFLIYIVYAWLNRIRDMGRLLGYLLLMAGAIVVALFLAYALTTRLEKELDIRGPRYTLEPFTDMRGLYPDWKINVSDKNAVPSREGTIYFTIFWMAFFRSRLLSLAILLPAILFGGAGVAIGRDWPSSLIAGILWSGAIASLLNRTPLAAFPRWVDMISLRLVESRLPFWVPSRPWKRIGPKAKKAPPAEDISPAIVGRGGAARGDVILDGLIARFVLPVLSAGGPISLEIRGAPPGVDNGRISPYVRYVTGIDGNPCVVVRGAWRRRDSFRRGGRLDKCRAATDAHLMLMLRGAPVPQLHFAREGRTGFPPRHFHLRVKQFIDGRPVDPASAGDAAAAMRALASLHVIERAEAGGVVRERVPRERYPHRIILRRVQRCMASVERNLPASELAFMGQQAIEWFWMRVVERLDENEPFVICRNDFSSDSAIIHDNQAIWIDFMETEFGMAGFDVSGAFQAWGSSPDAARALARTYFDSMPGGHWERFQKGFDLYTAMAALEAVDRHFRRKKPSKDHRIPIRMATLAARAMQGVIKPPADPASCADLYCAFFHGDAPLPAVVHDREGS